MAKSSDPPLAAYKKLAWIFAAALLLFGALWNFLPTQDPEAYFNFADKRTYYGLGNFFDVVSNLFFIYVGMFGVVVFFKSYSKKEKFFWEPLLVMSIGVFLTGWGSSYFHMVPTPENLVWDRLPITLVFAALFVLVLVDRGEVGRHRLWLLGVGGAALWSAWNTAYGFQDLRPYVFTQFGLILLIFSFLFLFEYGRIDRKYFFISMAFYAGAKACEVYDHQIFEVFVVSGHTIKHILSAAAVFAIYWGILRTRPAPPKLERRRRDGALLF